MGPRWEVLKKMGTRECENRKSVGMEMVCGILAMAFNVYSFDVVWNGTWTFPRILFLYIHFFLCLLANSCYCIRGTIG